MLTRLPCEALLTQSHPEVFMETFLLDQISVFLRGLVLGIVVAAPVGPVGLMTIKRTLSNGVPAGAATGLGAGFADAIFGAIAAFGVTAALGLLTGWEAEIRILGGLILLGHGIHSLRKKIHITKKG